MKALRGGGPGVVQVLFWYCFCVEEGRHRHGVQRSAQPALLFAEPTLAANLLCSTTLARSVDDGGRNTVPRTDRTFAWRSAYRGI